MPAILQMSLGLGIHKGLRGLHDTSDPLREGFAQRTLASQERIQGMTAQDLGLRDIEKALGEFIEKRDTPLGVQAQDDAVGVLHQLAVAFFADLKPLKGAGVVDADGDLLGDSHQEAHFALDHGFGRGGAFHGQDTQGLTLEDDRYADKGA